MNSVVLFSPLVLPSGTLVSATVEESFESFTEGSLVSQPFTQEIPLYRYPLRSDDEVHQAFPVTPSRQFTLQELREGRIHVSIGTAPTFIKGALVGDEGFTVTGEGDAQLVVPAGALTDTVSVSVESRDPLELGIGFEGLSLVAAAEVDLSSASLLSPGTLSVPVALASPDNLFAARYLFVAGQVDGVYLAAAWVFVVFRVLHSAVHCTINIVMLRFNLYLVSSLAVWFIAVRSGLQYLTS